MDILKQEGILSVTYPGGVTFEAPDSIYDVQLIYTFKPNQDGVRLQQEKED